MGRAPPRILVVDDETDMCWALENIMRLVGYTVTTATRGEKALKLMAEEPYAAAFVDIMLPDMDGLRLADAIRQRYPRTGIVLISGYFYQEDASITEGLEQGLFVGFLAKPFELEQVRHLARKAVEHAREM